MRLLLVPVVAALVLASLCGIGVGTDTWPVGEQTSLADPKLHQDFPSLCVDADGTPWIAYVEYDGDADRLMAARWSGDAVEVAGELAGPGIIHQPSMACDADGLLWVIWSEVDPDSNRWRLQARAIEDGSIRESIDVLDEKSGSAVFSDAKADGNGRVWVVWQSFRGAASDIYARVFDPATGEWSDEIRVTDDPAGDWEPRLAFGKSDHAYVVFDSSRGGMFNAYVAKVGIDGTANVSPLSKSPRYQGRVSVASAPDGRGMWVAWENGHDRWGKNSRGVDGAKGLNYDKRVHVVYYEFATGETTAAADVTPLLLERAKPVAGNPDNKNQALGVQALNLPEIAVDPDGQVWLAVRFYGGPCFANTPHANNWRFALTRYAPQNRRWTQPVVVEDSSFGQDRHCEFARDAAGRMWLAWPSDGRQTKKAGVSNVHLAKIDYLGPIPLASAEIEKPKANNQPDGPRWGDDTPERPRDDRHFWTFDGRQYGLYWGDFHRHTDVSNCRTPNDGCIVEQFRYACDMAKLDFLGTSDHTDVGKPYDPYEWWCNQKLADVFFAPGFFNSFYVYEREQRWPWGHRNVIFAERGGPIVYIKRGLYLTSPWQQALPAATGGGNEILPDELWQLLRKDGRPVTIISHTGATGMGTDWELYEKIDSAVENLVEIYQGARVSYEGTDTPQPVVGFPKSGNVKPDAHGSVKTGTDFGQYNNGVYQHALRNGHKLGVFASSDHISTHTTFGGVYAESFTRQGILDALQARRTVAATDKIFMEFSCNGHRLGEVFETDEKPKLSIAVHGTAPLLAVTIVRNERNYHEFTPKDTADLVATFTDEQPLAGENRYYVRVQQADGNMGWTSPVWVTYKK